MTDKTESGAAQVPGEGSLGQVNALCGQKCGPVTVPAGATHCPQCGHPLTLTTEAPNATTASENPTSATTADLRSGLAAAAGGPLPVVEATSAIGDPPAPPLTEDDGEALVRRGIVALGYDEKEAADLALNVREQMAARRRQAEENAASDQSAHTS